MSYDKIRSRILVLADLIGAPADMLPTYGTTRDFAHPHIEVDGPCYHYVVVERGEELQRHTSLDMEEIVFRTFASITFEMASDYELKHRHPTDDFRRLLFAEQERLMGILNQEWRNRIAARHSDIVSRHPFNDKGLT